MSVDFGVGMSQQIPTTSTAKTKAKKESKEFDEYECGNGPRPPVPGEESQASKMTTEGGSSSSSTSNVSHTPPTVPPTETLAEFEDRVRRWRTSHEYLLGDKEGVILLFKYVEEDASDNSPDAMRLKFYFACEGLKTMTDMAKVRKFIKLIRRDKYLEGIRIDVPEDLVQSMTHILRNPEVSPNQHIFDDLQKKVEQKIAETIYASFFESPVFIEYANQKTKELSATNVPTAASATYSQPSTSRSATAAAVAGSSGCSGSASYAMPSTSDGSAAAAFNRMNMDLSPIINSSNLQTLHEDTELKLNNEPAFMKTTTDRPVPKLTKDLLLATQRGRLEIRPQGAHGYTYSVPLNSSYNPVSRQHSERQSCSSASLTDSDVNSKDGKPYFPRKPTGAEDYRRAYMNPPTTSQRTVVKPRTDLLSSQSSSLKEAIEPLSKSRAGKSTYTLDFKLLYDKLCALKRHQDESERSDSQFTQCLNDKLSSAQAQARVLPIEDDDQAILDQHVSRVFSPYLSPGNASPKHLHRYQQRANEMSTSMPNFVSQALRQSRSIPEHASSAMFYGASKTTRMNKWSSQNIDSGISLYSADIPYNKDKEVKPNESLIDETMRRLAKDESRRIRKQMPCTTQTLGHPTNQMPTTSSHHTNSLTRTGTHETSRQRPDSGEDYIFAHYTFEDEKIPYRIRIPGRQITLKQFKESLPKKGNFRFFFKTTCDDRDNSVIQEEVVNDADTLPLYEGKVIGHLKSE